MDEWNNRDIIIVFNGIKVWLFDLIEKKNRERER